MRTSARTFLLLSSMVLSVHVFAQVRVGGRVGANFLIATQKIQPDPKNPPTNPKGLGMVFGPYVEVPFSDMVGIRPEMAFSFRRGKSELVDNVTLTNNTEVTNNQGAYTGTRDYKGEDDQRLTYFQINAPLMITPADGLRIMFGPSFNFLMGGKQNLDETTNYKGSITGQNQQGQQVTIPVDEQQFTTTKKKGSAAIKDFKKIDVAAMAGIGYTLPVGFDMDLRFYRGLTTSYDRSESTTRARYWTNLVEFTMGWTFGN
jgi:hypothetical protein